MAFANAASSRRSNNALVCCTTCEVVYKTSRLARTRFEFQLSTLRILLFAGLAKLLPPDCVVVSSPGFDDDLGVLQCVEDITVQ
jgi:hypothetical protein